MDLELEDAADVPARPPILCPGCPHRSVYSVLKKLKKSACGDIGCYTLGAVAPLQVVETSVCMGSSISTLHGLEKAKGSEYVKNWVACIGDSTFLHTGVNSLMNMVYNKGTGTVIIMDNSTTGMTGHQDHAATGKTLMGDTTYMINIYNLCKALGIENVVEVDAFDTKKLEEVIKAETARDAVSVIIAKSLCALHKDFVPKGKCVVDIEKCKKCGLCMASACPAIHKGPNGEAEIDPTMCNGCGLCMQSCNFGAISLVENK